MRSPFTIDMSDINDEDLIKDDLILIPLATSYSCESEFSALASIKTKNRNLLDVNGHLRLALSKTIPQFNVLIQGKQKQLYH